MHAYLRGTCYLLKLELYIDLRLQLTMYGMHVAATVSACRLAVFVTPQRARSMMEGQASTY